MMKWLKSIASYALIFVVIYTAVNYWRAPTVPDTLSAHTLDMADAAHFGVTPAVIKDSYQMPVLVYFWATWCGICSITSSNVQAISQDFPVLSIATTSGSSQQVQSFMQNKGYDFAMTADADGQIFEAWQGKVTPSFVIIKDGQVVQRFTGVSPLWSLKVRLWWASLH